MADTGLVWAVRGFKRLRTIQILALSVNGNVRCFPHSLIDFTTRGISSVHPFEDHATQAVHILARGCVIPVKVWHHGALEFPQRRAIKISFPLRFHCSLF